MHKPTTLIILLLILTQAMNLNAQNHYLKFFGFFILVVDHTSVSYEYSINKNHHIGLQLSASSITKPRTYYHNSTSIIGIYVNYRYFYLIKNKYSLFTQLETGIAMYIDGDSSREFYANDIGGGVLLGLRKTIGVEKRWSFDFGVGLDYVKRDYYRVKEDMYLICEGDPDCIENHIPPPLPDDEWKIIPRLVLEFVVKL